MSALPARKISKSSQKTSYQSYEEFYRRQHQEKMKKAAEILEKKQRRYQRQRKMNFLAKSLVGCLIIFSLLSVLVMRYATIFEVNYKIYGLEAEIKELNLKKEDLRIQIDSTIVLDNIEKVAMEDLGMQYPQPEQIVYIKSNWHYTLDEKYAKMDMEISDNSSQNEDVVTEIQSYMAHIRSWLSRK